MKHIKVLLATKEGRKILKTIIITTFSIFFILVATFIYILQTPIRLLKQSMGDEELEVIENFQLENSSGQFMVTEDFVFGNLKKYSNDLFDGIYYVNQSDKRWGSKPYGLIYKRRGKDCQDYISGYGCGIAASVMIINTLTDNKISMEEMAQYSTEHGYWCEGNGSYHALIPSLANDFPIKVTGIEKDKERVIQSLKDGKKLVAIMDEGHFTKHGHFIVLRGITEEGKILVADSASVERSKKEWDVDIIIKEVKPNSVLGGPIWAFEPIKN